MRFAHSTIFFASLSPTTWRPSWIVLAGEEPREILRHLGAVRLDALEETYGRLVVLAPAPAP